MTSFKRLIIPYVWSYAHVRFYVKHATYWNKMAFHIPFSLYLLNRWYTNFSRPHQTPPSEGSDIFGLNPSSSLQQGLGSQLLWCQAGVSIHTALASSHMRTASLVTAFSLRASLRTGVLDRWWMTALPGPRSSRRLS